MSFFLIKKQTPDPATNTQFKRKFIDPKVFLAYTLRGKTGEEMIKKLEQINLLDRKD